MKKNYFGIIERPDTKFLMGYINAKALGWDTKTWRFSTKIKTKREARAFVHKVYKSLTQNQNQNYKNVVKSLYPAPARESTVRTVGHACDDYLRNFEPSACFKCKLQPSVYVKYKQFNSKKCDQIDCKHRKAKINYTSIRASLNRIQCRPLGDTPFTGLKLDSIKDFIDDMRAKYKDKTISVTLDFFKAALNNDVDNNKLAITGNIKQCLNFRKKLRGQYKLIERKRPDHFTKDKFDAIFKEIENENLKIMILIAFNYPSRINELRTLKKNQFEMHRKRGFLKFAPVKNGNPREIKLTPELTTTLLKKRNENKKVRYFFVNSDNLLMTMSQIECLFSEARRRAGHEDVCIHQLRIRAATDAKRAGLDVSEIRDLGGWKSNEMVERYVKHTKSDNDRVFDRLESYKARC